MKRREAQQQQQQLQTQDSSGGGGKKRRREKVKELEDAVNTLESENLQLRLQLKVGKETVLRDAKEKQELTAELDRLVKKNCTDDEIRGVLETYVKKFSDYGDIRTQSVERHLDQLQKLLVPTQVTKMCMWSLHQDDSFFDADANAETNLVNGGSAIWSKIMEEISATEKQKQQIQSHRSDARQMAKDLRFTLRECVDLQRKMERKNRALGEEMKELQKILTPTQLAKFILWVHNNPTSMTMLDRLWRPMDDGKKINPSE